MEEPSVLDYVKSKLAFWKHSSIQIPPPERVSPLEEQEAQETSPENLALPDAREGTEGIAVSRVRPAVEFSGVGVLLAAGGLAMALFAQQLLEPPNRFGMAAAIFYIISAALVGAAYWQKRIVPAAAADDSALPTTLSFHKEGLVISLLLMMLAFVTFSRGSQDVATFNFFNTAIWLLSIAYLVWTFYLPRTDSPVGLRERASRIFAARDWKVSITRWTLLAVVVVGVVLFFRFYRLDSLPLDPVSDHAEKLLDVNDVLNGQYSVFFPRNTGREAFQFYWTALIIKVFQTGVTFFSLKLGTALIGLLTLVYMYRLGKEIGGRWVALLAVLFCGFSYWANIQSRIGLRFPLYPGFYAPMLFYLIRGLRRSSRNDFIWAGIWMGIGLHGYTSYRIVPFVAIACFVIYWLHHRSAEARRLTLVGLGLVSLVSLAVLMPLFRFALERPDMVAFRSLTRVGSLERALPGSPVGIFLSNTWNALTMFFWGNGDVWVHSIPNRPAMDVITAALFFLGVVLLVVRYIRKRTWVDLFMLVSIPLLLMPSILSLAFPNENPNLNRTAGAYVPAFLIVGIGLEALLGAIKRNVGGRAGLILAVILGLALTGFSAARNYNLVFRDYDQVERYSGWNTPEMGTLVRNFDQSVGNIDDAWVLAYPYWVDTRLVGMAAGDPTRDMAITSEQLPSTQSDPRSKLFIVNMLDQDGLSRLQQLYPDGRYWQFHSRSEGKDFLVFFVPAQKDLLP